jgi:glyoxylate reductase
MMRRMPPSVHVTRPMPEPVQGTLEREFELLPAPLGAEGLLTTFADRVDGGFLDSAGPQLRVVANFGVGVDNVDLEAARDRGVVVANTPDVLTRATAELAIALMLALLRRIVEGDRLIRRREPWEPSPTFMLGEGLDGKRLGIVGAGRIGRETARLAEAVGMNVTTAGRNDPLEPLLESADVVSLHVPSTPETRHLIDAAVLRRMRPTAVLVNTARGAVVDEAALVEALRRGEIAGAALDVYETEPVVREELLGFENVVLTPHIGSATRRAREAMGMLCVDALRAVLVDGRRPANAVVP